MQPPAVAMSPSGSSAGTRATTSTASDVWQSFVDRIQLRSPPPALDDKKFSPEEDGSIVQTKYSYFGRVFQQQQQIPSVGRQEGELSPEQQSTYPSKKNTANLDNDDDDNRSVATAMESVISTNTQKTVDTITSRMAAAPIPQRLIDYFCVIGPDDKMSLEPTANPQKTIDATMGPCDLRLQPDVLECYPKERGDVDFPKHLPTFCFPSACNAIKIIKNKSPSAQEEEQLKPTLFTLVLTSSAGNRLYASVLTLYNEERRCLSDFSQVFWADGRPLPSWLKNPDNLKQRTKKEQQQESSSSEDADEYDYYLPKCLVVISHHAFFAAQTAFLQQLVRIYQSKSAPLPLERYIANFVDDVPLPPLGRTQVRWNCFTKDAPNCIMLARPAPNELPLVNFSYQPLFRCLSVSNILVIWGVLLQEGRVALCSRHTALLTPVAEALLSLLFPLNWQGMYIPVLPFHMHDVLDAPVPFLVGLQSNPDGTTTTIQHQPAGVVMCDLDEDIVHMGYDEIRNYEPRMLPDLPPDVMRLKVELEEAADPLYLIPPCGIKGRMTNGAKRELLENSQREPYAQMTRLRKMSKENTHRQFILFHAERVQQKYSRPLFSEDFYISGKEQITRDRSDVSIPVSAPVRTASDTVFDSLKVQSRSIQAHADRVLAFAGQTFATPSAHVVVADNDKMEQEKRKIAAELYNFVRDDEYSHLANSVRHSFLRFFTNFLLIRYKKYYMSTNDYPQQPSGFQHDVFLSSLHLSQRHYKCMKGIIRGQMFDMFLHESSIRRKLFDEHIILQRNAAVWSTKKTAPTPFLDNQKWKVTKTITPRAPCAVGVWQGSIFSYSAFPKLNEEEFVSSSDVSPWAAFCHGALCTFSFFPG